MNPGCGSMVPNNLGVSAPVSAPTVSGLSPTNGPTTGATVVTISGTQFLGVTAVAFGANAAASYTVLNATTIQATSPAGSAGVVDVRVTNTIGQSGIVAADQFTYNSAGCSDKMDFSQACNSMYIGAIQ